MIYTQIRYFNKDNEMNQFIDSNAQQSALIAGQNILSNIEITKLGIQTLPGTRFCFNGTEHMCIVGSSGIWELDLSGNGQGLTIDALQFDAKSIENIETNDDAYLILDLVYTQKSA